jgi:methylenetetrahydrofolate--tRNA-(uracil-5-)-methyltransferase
MSEPSAKPVHVIGGGLAGSEAAWQLARAGVPVVLHEMRPQRKTDAHQTDGLAELVCSNSFRSDDAENNAVGLLHAEMRRLGSLIMAAGDATKLPAGGALAVDRDAFSERVTQQLAADPLVTLERGEIAGLPPEDWDSVIVATGPLTSPALSQAVGRLGGEDYLAFFDAIAPIVYKESIDLSKAWFQSRYDKPGPGGGTADYVNCPLDEAQYKAFIQALIDGEKTEFKDWEASTPYFEGCLPIEVMAERGPETLRFGPMKPVGLHDPHSDARPYAVVQLRQDNALGTLYNIVGFQTKLKYGEQARIFRMIPGLENAEFARLGGLHRNTFINSPKLLDPQLRLKALPRLRFAGQITGVEGYVESAAIGLLAGRFAAAERLGRDFAPPPATTAHGALLAHITGGADAETFQPMNVNFGLFPPLAPPPGKRKVKKKDRKPAMSARALADLDAWRGEHATAAE